MSDDTRDRLIKLETEFLHMSDKLDGVAKQVKEMHELLLQARGARWALFAMAGIGGFVSGKLSHIVPWFGAVPK